MSTDFERRAVRTAYRDVLFSPRGQELRWVVNVETLHDTATACGVRATCAATSSWTQRSAGKGSAVSFQTARSW